MFLNWKHKGNTKNPPTEAPLTYLLLKYRERFQLSWKQLLETPMRVIDEDLEMLSIEKEFEESNKKSGNSEGDNIESKIAKLNAKFKP